MKTIAYLTNQYPTPTHSFIRREIAALESLGWRVHRFSHRRSAEIMTDPADLAELERTTVLLDAGTTAILASVLRQAISNPRRWSSTLRLAFAMSRSSQRKLAAHLGYFALACRLAHELRARGAPHLHVHHGSNPADVARLCHALCGQSYSLTAHGPEFLSGDRINFANKIEAAEFVVVVSEHGRRRLLERHPEGRDKILLIPCGLDDQWIDRTPTSIPRAAQLVHVARLQEEKNPQLLLRAAAIVCGELDGFRLLIAGDGTLRPQLARLIEELGIGRQVTLLGWRNQEEVMTHLEESRALILSSDAEGLPVVLMEAFALARPSIATDVGGVAELVVPGETGWLVPAGDPRALAAAMLECLRAPAERLQSMGDAARDRARAFSAIASAQLLSAAFCELRSGALREND